MKKLFFLVFSVVIFFFATPTSFAQTAPANNSPVPTDGYIKAEVIKIEKEEIKNPKTQFATKIQTLSIRLLEGPQKDKTVTLSHESLSGQPFQQRLQPGDTIIVNAFPDRNGHETYYVFDKYRLNTLLMLIGGFMLVIVITMGKRGAGSVLGMLISLSVISFYIVPQVIAGNDPLVTSILGALIIMIVTIYVAHGFSQQTSIAIGSTFISLVIAGMVGYAFVNLTGLSGLGSEDAYSLQLGLRNVNFQGLLLGGIIIGALGVLSEITTTQSATIFELARTDHRLTFQELIKKGLSVGKEHVLSLVNTLILTYAGASIAIFIFIVLSVQTKTQPLWVLLNSELIAEEIIRTLAGSIGLILAVPITTIIAAFFCKYSVKIS